MDERLSSLGEDRGGILQQLGWREESTPAGSAAWALWGALVVPVLSVARAAQRTAASELEWQVNHLKQLLAE